MDGSLGPDGGESAYVEGIVFGRGNVEVDGKITYLPIYMTTCLLPADDAAGESFVIQTVAV